MKRILLLALLLFIGLSAKAQACEEYMDFVKNESYGTIFNSFNTEAISKVTFYNVMIDYKTYYFAIMCFKSKYYGCSEYIYQVASNTKMYYSINYLESAGKAF